MPDGTPNLSPKGTTAVLDDAHLVFTAIRSPRSIQNIERNPSVEINVVDPLVRKGYRFKGRGVVHRSDEIFQRGCQMYRDLGLTLEIRAVVSIQVERALPVISPLMIEVRQKSRSKIDGADTGASCGAKSINDVGIHLSDRARNMECLSRSAKRVPPSRTPLPGTSVR